jgi:hypothetical protein
MTDFIVVIWIARAELAPAELYTKPGIASTRS